MPVRPTLSTCDLKIEDGLYFQFNLNTTGYLHVAIRSHVIYYSMLGFSFIIKSQMEPNFSNVYVLTYGIICNEVFL
jgi:hypothetical protein